MDNPIKAISNKNVLLITLAVFSIALIPRIYHQSSLSGDQVRTILAPDEQAYEMLVNNRDITPDMSPSYFLNPLYPTVLSGLKVIFGNQLTPARWFNAILGSLSCLFIFLLSRKYVSKLSALIITVILAFYGPLIFLEGKLLATTIAVFLVSFSLYIYQLSREKYHIVWGMIAGLLMGLAVWARPNIILVWPFFWFDPLIRVKKTRNLVICFQTAFILTFGIMALKNSIVAGEFITGTGSSGINLYISNHPGATGVFTQVEGVTDNPLFMANDFKRLAENATGRELTYAQSDKYWLKQSINYIYSFPVKTANLWLKKLLLIFSPDEIPQNINYQTERNEFPLLRLPLFSYIFILPFSLSGFIIGWKNRSKLYPLYFFAVAYSFSMMVFWVSGRNRLILIPVLAVFAALGIEKIIQVFKTRVRGHGWIWITIPLVVIIVMLILKPSRRSDIDEAWQWYNRGTYLQSKGDVDGAEDAFRKSISQEIKIPETLINLSIILIRKGEYKEAEQYLNQVIQTEPSNFRAHLNLGNLYFRSKRYPEALGSYRKTLRIKDNYSMAWRNLGIVYSRIDSVQQAKDSFNRAIILDPSDSISIKLYNRIENIEK